MGSDATVKLLVVNTALQATQVTISTDTRLVSPVVSVVDATNAYGPISTFSLGADDSFTLNPYGVAVVEYGLGIPTGL